MRVALLVLFQNGHDRCIHLIIGVGRERGVREIRLVDPKIQNNRTAVKGP